MGTEAPEKITFNGNGLFAKILQAENFNFGSGATGGTQSPSVNIEQATFTGTSSQAVKIKDPTRDFAFAKEYLLNVEEGFITAAQELVERSMVVISCDLRVVAMSGARHLTQYRSTDWQADRVRCYTSLDAAAAEEAVALQGTAAKGGESFFSLHALRRSLDAIPEFSTILVDLTAERRVEDARSFMSPFLEGDTQDNYIKGLSSQLAERHLRVIFLVPTAIGASEIPEKRVHVWTLDPMKILVAQAFPSEPEKMLEIVRRQVEIGDWGSDPLEGIWTAFKERTLQERISAYEGYTVQEREQDERDIATLLSPTDPLAPLNEAVLFAAVYFAKLSEPHFERVLEVLIGDDRTAEIERTEVVRPSQQGRESSRGPFDQSVRRDETSPSDPTDISIQIGKDKFTINRSEDQATRSGGSCSDLVSEKAVTDIKPVQRVHGGEREKLVDIWRDGVQGRVARKCRLALLTDSDGRKSFGFEDPHLTTLTRSALERESPFHFTKYFERILDSGLVFDRSAHVSDSTLELIRDGMLRSPDEYNWEWLGRWIINALVMLDLVDPQDSEPVIQLFKHLTIKAQQSLVLARWSKLLRMLLGHDQLEKVAKDLLNNLIDAGQYTLVLEFVRRLRSAPGLDTMHWLKRLIGEGDADIREPAIDFLVGYVKSNCAENPELVSILHSWLPRGTAVSSLHPLQEAALRVPLEVSVRELIEQDLDSNRPPHLLFPILSGQGYRNSPSTFAESMDLLLYPTRERLLPSILGLLIAVADFLSGSIFWEAIAEEADSPEREQPQTHRFSVIALTLNNLLTEDTAYEGLIALLLTGWYWLLTAGSNDEVERNEVEEMVRRISDTVAQQMDAEQLQMVRKILNEMRRRVTDAIGSHDLRKDRKHLSHFKNMSKAVSNALYRSRQRAGTSPRTH